MALIPKRRWWPPVFLAYNTSNTPGLHMCKRWRKVNFFIVLKMCKNSIFWCFVQIKYALYSLPKLVTSYERLWFWHFSFLLCPRAWFWALVIVFAWYISCSETFMQKPRFSEILACLYITCGHHSETSMVTPNFFSRFGLYSTISTYILNYRWM